MAFALKARILEISKRLASIHLVGRYDWS